MFACSLAAVLYATGGGRRSVALTLASVPTGRHYTYRIRRAAETGRDGRPARRRPWFVDDGDRGQYLGRIADRGDPAGDSPSPDDSPSPGPFLTDARGGAAAAFSWAWPRLLAGAERAREVRAAGDAAPGPLPAGLEVWHDGACCRCGRQLTDPASVEAGIGPTCRARMGVA